MKSIFVLWIFSLSLIAGEIDWNDTYAEALAQAKKESKPIMVVITTEQCRWCRKLESTTFQDEQIIKRVNTSFAPVHLTRDKSIYPKNLTAKMVPMSYFLDESGKILVSMPGYWPSEDYHSILDDALRKIKN